MISADGGIRGEDDFSIMFHGLKKDLVSGENIPAILKFSSGMNINIKFVIGELFIRGETSSYLRPPNLKKQTFTLIFLSI